MSKSNVTTRDIAGLLALYILFGLAQASNEYRTLFLQGQGLTATECGRILALGSLLSAVSRPLAGAVADKLRSRRVVYLATVCAWLAILLLMLLTQHVRLAGFALCAGIVPLLSVSEPVTYGMIEASGVNASLMKPGLDFSFIRICLSIGYSVINFLYTPIVNRFGPSAPFWCTAALAVAMLAFSGTMRTFETAPAGQAASGAAAEKLPFRSLLQNYYLITFVLLNFILFLGSATQSYLVYLIDALGMNTALLGIATGIRVLGEIVIMPLVPLIKRRVSLPMLQAAACLLRVAQMAVFITCKNPYVILAAIMLNGISSGITLSTTAVYLRAMAPQGLDTTTLSLSNCASNIGMIVMNLAGGMVIDALGVFSLYRISFCVLLLWLVLYFGTWAFGVYALKKEPVIPMFTKNR